MDDRTRFEDDNQKLEAIKEIIFGQNIKEYNEKFEQIKNRFNEIEANFDNELKQIVRGLEASIDLYEERITKHIVDLKIKLEDQNRMLNNNFKDKFQLLNTQKVDKHELSNLLKEIAERLTKNDQNL